MLCCLCHLARFTLPSLWKHYSLQLQLLERTWPYEASWKQSSQTNRACRQLCQAKGTWVSFHIILLALRTKSKKYRICPCLSETGYSVSHCTANSLFDCVIAYTRLLQTAPNPQSSLTQEEPDLNAVGSAKHFQKKRNNTAITQN